MEVDKILLINKPLRWTSFDVVNKIRYILHTKKVGHCGTLDPLATGLLIICTGKKTKEINTFMDLEKEYTGTFSLGATTPSYDLETTVSDKKDVTHLSDEVIHEATKAFIGKIEQLPPVYSAIRIKGQRAYDLARAGKEVVMEKRAVEVEEFVITAINLPEVSFRIRCSKGTYIRSLAHDFGAALNVGAHLSSLCRTKIGSYHIENAQTLEELQAQIF